MFINAVTFLTLQGERGRKSIKKHGKIRLGREEGVTTNVTEISFKVAFITSKQKSL